MSISSDDESSSGEILIQFSTTCSSNYEVEAEVEVESESRAFSIIDTLGLVGIACSHDDSLADCMINVDDVVLSHNLTNEPYRADAFPGDIHPYVPSHLPSFPLEENSALAVFAYSPWKDSLIIDPQSCYVPIDIVGEKGRNDYLYSGQVFQSKEGYKQSPSFNLPLKHACYKIVFTICSRTPVINDKLQLKIDTLVIVLDRRATMKLNLKNGDITGEGSLIRDSIVYSGINHQVKDSVSKYSRSLYLDESIRLRSLFVTGVVDTTRVKYMKTFTPLEYDRVDKVPGHSTHFTIEYVP